MGPARGGSSVSCSFSGLTMPVHPADDREADPRFPRWEREEGQTMVEYGFVLVAVALVAIAAFQAFGGRVSALVNTVDIT